MTDHFFLCKGIIHHVFVPHDQTEGPAAFEKAEQRKRNGQTKPRSKIQQLTLHLSLSLSRSTIGKFKVNIFDIKMHSIMGKYRSVLHQ